MALQPGLTAAQRNSAIAIADNSVSLSNHPDENRRLDRTG
jgi:hypothetical protein